MKQGQILAMREHLQLVHLIPLKFGDFRGKEQNSKRVYIIVSQLDGFMSFAIPSSASLPTIFFALQI
jgi:hypothetical protein